MIKAGSAIVLKKGKKFLLQLRDNDPEIENPNEWGFFGGGIEAGENPIQAALRELKEELNLEIKEKDLRPIMNIKHHGRDVYIFLAELKKDLTELTLKEGQEMKLFSKKELSELDNLIPEIKDMLHLFP